MHVHGKEAGTVLHALKGHTGTVLAPFAEPLGLRTTPVSCGAPLALPARSPCTAALHALV